MLIASAGSVYGQETPPKPPVTTSSQQELGGPPPGQQLQQEQQRRRQQLQQSGEPPLPALQPSSTSPKASTPAAPTAVLGTSLPGEPRGSTTPRAVIGSLRGPGGLGGVQTGAVRVLTIAPARLSLPEAIAISLDNNLTTLLTVERAEEAQALSQQVRSFLLPNISGSAYQLNRTLNLAAQGFASQEKVPAGGGAGGIPTFVGPFNSFDARLNFSQALLNLAAWREYKSSRANG